MPPNERESDAGNRPQWTDPGVEYGPLRDLGSHVAIPAHQWLRLTRALDAERVTTFMLRKALMTVITLLEGLATAVTHDEMRARLLRTAAAAREAATMRFGT